MIYIEQHIDLFSLSQDYMLAHCVSADYALGAGIARTFRERFNMHIALKMTGTCYSWRNTGRCVIISMNKAFQVVSPESGIYRVANLVTKQAFCNKPTLQTVREALTNLKEQLQSVPAYRNIKRIGMPKIACGLDGRKWEDVSQIIQEVFRDMDIEIRICDGKGVFI